MTLLRSLLAAILLGLGMAHAQAPASSEEISFWETVRDSKNPAELQAYIDQYPNGRFVVLARARLSALQRPGARPAAPATPVPQPAQRLDPPPQASVASQSYAAGVRVPQAGDTWTYRLTYPRLRGQWGQPTRPPATHVVKAGAVADGRIVDHLSIDGGTPSEAAHPAGAYLLPQGVSVFSPYLASLSELSASSRLGRVEILDPPCRSTYACEASARAVGAETVSVPAGTFATVKVLVQESWRSGAGSGDTRQAALLIGGRTLTVWYAPEVKRAVKYSSRMTVGDVPPVESNFDLELVSYQLK